MKLKDIFFDQHFYKYQPTAHIGMTSTYIQFGSSQFCVHCGTHMLPVEEREGYGFGGNLIQHGYRCTCEAACLEMVDRLVHHHLEIRKDGCGVTKEAAESISAVKPDLVHKCLLGGHTLPAINIIQGKVNSWLFTSKLQRSYVPDEILFWKEHIQAGVIKETTRMRKDLLEKREAFS